MFLCHARLYVFADKYDIEALRDLSLSKLQQTLASFTLYKERVEDAVDLLQYCYANTLERVGKQDSLRVLVILYVACVVEKLAGNKRFQSLLREANAISVDLFSEMLKRMD